MFPLGLDGAHDERALEPDTKVSVLICAAGRGQHGIQHRKGMKGMTGEEIDRENGRVEGGRRGLEQER